MAKSNCTLYFGENASTIRISLSAVRHIGEYLWLGCDETATLERLTYQDDTAVDHHSFAIADFLPLPRPADEEIDIEGLAFSDHYLWFVGSHSLKRKSVKLAEETLDENLKRLATIEREENRYTLGRIPLVNGQLHQTCPHPDDPQIELTAAQLRRKKTGNELTHRLADNPYLGAFLQANIPGKDNGFDIEGIAIMGDRLLVGLRGPVLRGWSVLLEMQLAVAEPGMLKLQKIGKGKERYCQHFLDLEGLGIRDLCVWDETLLVLAGPTMDQDSPVKIFSLSLAEIQAGKSLLQPTFVVEVPHGQGCDRAEGITLIGEAARELLVVYDAPSEKRLQDENAVLADRFPLVKKAAKSHPDPQD